MRSSAFLLFPELFSLLIIHSLLVFLIAHLLHPLDNFATERFLNRDMGHGRGRRRAMPMLFVLRAPHHVPGSYLCFGTALALHPAAPGCHDECLTERVSMPRRAGARLECDTRATRA